MKLFLKKSFIFSSFYNTEVSSQLSAVCLCSDFFNAFITKHLYKKMTLHLAQQLHHSDFNSEV